MKTDAQPSDTECSLHRATRLLGDRWTLLILRDVMLDGHRTYRDLLQNNPEGIASNILSNRLKRMVADGLLTRADGADARRRKPYALTERAIALVPVLAELGVWGLVGPPTAYDLRARLLYGGGRRLWTDLAADLRAEHLGMGTPSARPVRDRLSEACSESISGRGPIVL